MKDRGNIIRGYSFIKLKEYEKVITIIGRRGTAHGMR